MLLLHILLVLLGIASGFFIQKWVIKTILFLITLLGYLTYIQRFIVHSPHAEQIASIVLAVILISSPFLIGIFLKRKNWSTSFLLIIGFSSIILFNLLDLPFEVQFSDRNIENYTYEYGSVLHTNLSEFDIQSKQSEQLAFYIYDAWCFKMLTLKIETTDSLNNLFYKITCPSANEEIKCFEKEYSELPSSDSIDSAIVQLKLKIENYNGEYTDLMFLDGCKFEIEYMNYSKKFFSYMDLSNVKQEIAKAYVIKEAFLKVIEEINSQSLNQELEYFSNFGF